MRQIQIWSYGCKNGEFDIPGVEARLIPCHDIPNPWRNDMLREMDGRDQRLQAWVMGHSAAKTTLKIALRDISEAIHPTNNSEDPFTVAFECIGGRHRSASLAECLHRELTARGIPATVNHRELN